MEISARAIPGQSSWQSILFPDRFRSWLFLILALYTAFGYLSHPDFWGKHTESRRAEIAREFLLADGQLLIPRLNGKPILTKPPVFYWLAAGSFWLTGRVSEASARLPSVISGLLTAWLIYRIGCLWMGRSTGFLAAAILFSSAHFLLFLRLAEIDMTFCALIWLSLWFFIKNLILFDQQATSQTKADAWSHQVPVTPSMRLNFIGFWIAAGLAFLTKGPYALVFPIGGLLFAGASFRDRRALAFIKGFLFNPGLVPFFLISAPWFLYLMLMHADLIETMRAQVNSLYPKSSGQPFYYYLLSLACFAPWFLLLPPAMVPAFRAPRLTDRFFAWFIVVGMAVASLIEQKKAVYLLPLYPAGALLMGSLLCRADSYASQFPRWVRYVKFVLALIGILIPVAVIGLIAALYYLSSESGVKVNVINLLWGTWAIALAFMGLGQIKAKPFSGIYLGQTQTLALTLVAAMTFHHFLPLLNPYQSVKVFARQIESKVPASNPLFMYRRDNFAFPFYAGRFIPVIQQNDLALATHCWLILQRQHLAELEKKARCTILLDNLQLVKAKSIYPVLDMILIEYLPHSKKADQPGGNHPAAAWLAHGFGSFANPNITDRPVGGFGMKKGFN
jgi:4-amino-4-deoxy-L-arabinose transferase-like glycosyltransferase